MLNPQRVSGQEEAASPAMAKLNIHPAGERIQVSCPRKVKERFTVRSLLTLVAVEEAPHAGERNKFCVNGQYFQLGG
jgi:hypothetical protein